MNKFITKTVCVLLLLLAVGVSNVNAQPPVGSQTDVTISFRNTSIAFYFLDVTVNWSYYNGFGVITSASQTITWTPSGGGLPTGPFSFILQGVLPQNIIKMGVIVESFSLSHVLQDQVTATFTGYQPTISVLFP